MLRQGASVVCGGALTVLDRWQSAQARAGIPSPLLPWMQRRLRLHQHHWAYKGEPDDLFVASYPKSGTTLVQMLLYQIMTDGHMRIGHISDFAPHLEIELYYGRREWGMSALPRPRVVKTHLPYRLVPRGPGRYIYVMRNCLDVLISAYHQFVRAYPQYAGTCDEFARMALSGHLEQGTWSGHVAEWTANKAGLNVLYVTYEELQTDLVESGMRIAKFCDIERGEVQWQTIASKCSFEFMRAHERQFDPIGARRSPHPPADDHFIRRGVVGGGRAAFSSETIRLVAEQFQRHLGNLTVPQCLYPDSAGLSGCP